MDAFNPFKLAAFWTGMALGIPMLATELAAEVWGTRPKPAPVPKHPGMTRTVEEIQTRYSTDGLNEVRAAFESTQVVDLGAPIVLEPGRIEEVPPGFVVRSGPRPAPKPRKKGS